MGVLISDLTHETARGVTTLSALITWEQVKRPNLRVYFRFPTYERDPILTVDPFVIAAAVPAMAAGESCIKSEYALDPVLVQGLPSAMAILKFWLRDISEVWTLPKLEMPIEQHTSALTRGTASFYSGGVDAVFTLLKNHASLPLGAAGRIDSALLVYGFDLGYRDKDEYPEYDAFFSQAEPFLHANGVEALRVETNLRTLDPRSGFWGRAFNGFALSAVAQVFGYRLSEVLIGTSGERLSETVQQPWGSHPILHNYLDSSLVQLRSPFVEYSRLLRVRAIGQNSDSLRQLRVCQASRIDTINCGECEKCVRTRLALLLANADPNAGFGGPQLTPSLLEKIHISNVSSAADHEELRDEFLAANLLDYAHAEQHLLSRWKHYEDWRLERGVKGNIKKQIRSIKNRFATFMHEK